MAPLTEPGISPRALDTVAVTGGSPVASRTGNVISVPEPTMVLMVPAPIPAAKTASASQMDKAISFGSVSRLPAVKVEGPPPIMQEGRACQSGRGLTRLPPPATRTPGQRVAA